MPDNKTLTVEIAREWNQNSSLKEYTSIDDDAAEVLVGYKDADLDFDGITSISPKTVQILSKHISLGFKGLSTIGNEVASALSDFNGFLDLSGITSLSVAAAQSITKSAQFIDLSGLTSVSDPVAEVLSKCKGRLHLCGLTSLTHPRLAAKLAEVDDELDVPGLTGLSDEVAAALSKTNATLLLRGPKSIPNFDLAWKLFLQNPNDDFLSSITSISPAEATIIANYKGDVYLEKLTSLSDIAAETLSRHQGVLGLRGLTSLTDSAAEILSKHKDIVILPQSLSKKVAGHFLERFCSGSKQIRQATASDGKIRAIDLEQGKLYDCKVYGDSGPEDCSIVQLAIDATSNRRLVLSQARYIYQKDPEFVRKLATWEFFLLSTERCGNPNWQKSIDEMHLDENGDTLQFGDDGDCYYDFIETDVIKL